MPTDDLAIRPARARVSVSDRLTWVPVALTFCVLGIGGATGWAVAMKHLREDGIVVGAVISLVTMVLNYWFGTSKSSERNGAAVRDLAANAAVPTVSTTATEGSVTTDVNVKPAGGP